MNKLLDMIILDAQLIGAVTFGIVVGLIILIASIADKKKKKRIYSEVKTQAGYEEHFVRPMIKEYAKENNYYCARDVQFFNSKNANDTEYREAYNRNTSRFPSHSNFNNIVVTDRAIFVEYFLPARFFTPSDYSPIIHAHQRDNTMYTFTAESRNGGVHTPEQWLENPMYYMDLWIKLFREKCNLTNRKDIPIYIGVREYKAYQWCPKDGTTTQGFDVENTLIEKEDYTMYFMDKRTMEKYDYGSSKIKSYRVRRIKEINDSLLPILDNLEMQEIRDTIWNCDEIVFDL